jgi:hypothetical protein
MDACINPNKWSDKEIFGQDEAALFFCQDEAALGSRVSILSVAIAVRSALQSTVG